MYFGDDEDGTSVHVGYAAASVNSVLHNDKIIGAGVAPERPRAPLRYYRNRLTRPRCGITVTKSTTQQE